MKKETLDELMICAKEQDYFISIGDKYYLDLGYYLNLRKIADDKDKQ